MTSVCVIGGGPLGLSAAKQFLDEGFEVTGFETREWLGGLWKASPDASLSAHHTTVFNVSKWGSCFSDFPFGDEVDTFPTCEQLWNWLNQYADRFGLRKCYQLSTKVLHIDFEAEYPRWAVTVQDLLTLQTRIEYFDKICVATGSFQGPRKPHIDGIEQFQGRVLHSLDFYNAEGFEDQNVLIIGFHHTAMDIGDSLEGTAKKIFFSHRQGAVLLSKFNPDGSTFDSLSSVRMVFTMAFMLRYCGTFFNWIMQRTLVNMSKAAFSPLKKSWGLDPPPSMAVHTPLIADAVWPQLQSGFADIVPQVRRIIGPRTAELTNGQILDDIDSIIFATGYEIALPKGLFPNPVDGAPLDPYALAPKEDTVPLLYHGVTPIHSNEAVRNSLAVIGHGVIPFPGMAQFELASMAIAQIWKGKSALPPFATQQMWHKKRLEWRAGLRKQYKPLEGSTFYPCLLPYQDHLNWLDQTAGTGLYQNLGGATGGWFNWRTWKLWWNDRTLYKAMTTGFFTPVIWRMFETGKRRALDWETGRAMILSEQAKIKKAQAAKLEEISAKKTD